MKETNKDLIEVSIWQLLFMLGTIILAVAVLINAPAILEWTQKVQSFNGDVKIAKWSVQSVYERDPVFMQNVTNVKNVIANRCQIYASDYVEACQQRLTKELLK